LIVLKDHLKVTVIIIFWHNRTNSK